MQECDPNRLSALSTLGQACYLDSNQGHFTFQAPCCFAPPPPPQRFWPCGVLRYLKQEANLKALRDLVSTPHSTPPHQDPCLLESVGAVGFCIIGKCQQLLWMGLSSRPRAGWKCILPPHQLLMCSPIQSCPLLLAPLFALFSDMPNSLY
jgi:hypothetical protein